MKVWFSLLVCIAIASGNDVMLQDGKQIYEDTCVSCHGVDGKVNVKINLVVNPRDLQKSILNEEQTYKIIKYGAHYWGASSDIMPAFGTVYDEKQLRSVAHYISETFNPDAQKRVDELYAQSEAIPKEKQHKMFKRGKKIYKRNCSWCHGVDAKGDGEATHNPEKSIYPYDLTKTLLDEKQMFLYAKYGGKFWGTHKDDMPSWKRKYKDFTLKSVIYYIEETYKKDRK